jgi:phenylacetate-CoA ligase
MPDYHEARADLLTLQLKKLNSLYRSLFPINAFYARKLHDGGLVSAAFESLDDLQRLPFTTKQELLDDQAAHPPFGTNLTAHVNQFARYHQTSGSTGQPLRWLDTPTSWTWMLDCWRLIYEMSWVSHDDRIFFPFSFGPFLGFWAAFDGAARMGCLCFPGGGMTTTARLRFLRDTGATVVCCTPTYALRMAEVAEDEGIDLAGTGARTLILAGEPGASIPETRNRIRKAWNARVYDHWGMTEVGSLGAACFASGLTDPPGGFHLLETECIPEVIDPLTGRPVPPGTEGELVITNLGRIHSPLLRYRTGDRVVADPEPCPCGKPWMRVRGGILGRADDMVFIRGNNVYPAMIESIVRRFPEVEEFQIVVEHDGPATELRLRVEGGSAVDSVIASRLADAVRDAYHFRPVVEVVPTGTLPRAEMKSRRIVRKL